MENKTGKYFKYAIGEIVLVVIGILIALSINNWNEVSKNKQLKQVYIKSLISELNNNIKTHERLLTIFDSRIDSYNKLFNTINAEKISTDSLKKAFHNADSFVGVAMLNKTAFEELINSNNFQIFEKELRDKILFYYNELDDWVRRIDKDLREIEALRLEMYMSLDLAFLAGFKNKENDQIKGWESDPNSLQFLKATNFFTRRKLMMQEAKSLTIELIETHNNIKQVLEGQLE
ncbi:DUF6090 family protein [Flavobacteriaceae bacterium S0862]|nr:DUF6090 family protein [Flavobacteriaceae bacterium S0862]